MTEIRHTITERWHNGPHGPVRYWQSEPTHGLPVLFVHGYGALIEHWRRISRPVAREHTFYALDLYYFGFSAKPKQPPSKEMWAEQIADFARTMFSTPAVVVGHSMGGVAVAQFARTYPEMVKGLVLVDSAGLMDPDNSPSNLSMFFFNTTLASGIGEVVASAVAKEWGVRQSLQSVYYDKTQVTPELVETFYKPLRQPGGPQGYLAVSRSFNRLLLDMKPGEISVPTLLLWGEQDRSMPPAIAEYFKRTVLPQAEIVVLPATGHCPFDETPEAFCDALLPWLRALVTEA